MRTDTVWQNSSIVQTFLTGVRGAIPFAVDQINTALQVLEQTGIPVRRVADLGCGDGTIAEVVLTRFPHAEVVAIDFSKPMLKQAAQRLSSFSDRVHLLQADLFTSDWQANLAPFDAVLSGYCIHHLPNDRKQALYREIYDLLNPSGCFLNIEHVASASPLLESLFNEGMVDAIYNWHHTQGGTSSRQEIAQQYVYREDKKANILAPVELQCQWLRAIGFEHVDCYFKWLELSVFGGIKQRD
jgi:ubiquinone/menaquinone biosynthesis C-methylase UbiE